MINIINGTSSISLRIVDWFVTNYSKKNYIVYMINKDNKMEKVNSLMQIIQNIQFMKEIGLIIKKMDKEKCSLKMEIFMKENFKMIKQKEKEK